MANGLSLDRTVRNVGVLEALSDDEYETDAKPYRDHQFPGSVHAVHYDIGDQGVAYADLDPWAIPGSPGSGNTGGAFRSDGVDIEPSSDPQGFTCNVGWIESLERLQYSVTVVNSGTFDIEFRVSSGASGGRFIFSLGGETAGSVTVPATGGWQHWQSVWLRGVELMAGEQMLQISVRSGCFNFNTMRFTEVPATASEDNPDEAWSQVHVFPNPTLGPATVRVDLVEPAEVSALVFDALGRRVGALPVRSRGIVVHELAVDLALAPGVYSLQVVVDARGEVQRLDRALTVIR